MKTVAGVSLGMWGDLLRLWEEGGLTDVVMTGNRICAYFRKELVYAEEVSEEDVVSFVSETVPAEDEKEWGEAVRSGKLFKYSFVTGSLLVRCHLWDTGVHLRFLPVGNEGLSEEAKVPDERFVVHKGSQGSGKTRGLIAQVYRLSAELDERVVIYADVQEIYVPRPAGLVVFISRRKVRSAGDFYDLAKGFASTVVVQYPKEDELEVLEALYREGVRVLVEGNVDLPFAFEVDHDKEVW